MMSRKFFIQVLNREKWEDVGRLCLSVSVLNFSLRAAVQDAIRLAADREVPHRIVYRDIKTHVVWPVDSQPNHCQCENCLFVRQNA